MSRYRAWPFPRADARGGTGSEVLPAQRPRGEVVVAFQLYGVAAFGEHGPVPHSPEHDPLRDAWHPGPIGAPRPAALGAQCQPDDKMGAMSFRRLPATAAQRAARLLPVPVGMSEAAVRQAAWVARCVGRGQSAPDLEPEPLRPVETGGRMPFAHARGRLALDKRSRHPSWQLSRRIPRIRALTSRSWKCAFADNHVVSRCAAHVSWCFAAPARCCGQRLNVRAPSLTEEIPGRRAIREWRAAS